MTILSLGRHQFPTPTEFSKNEYWPDVIFEYLPNIDIVYYPNNKSIIVIPGVADRYTAKSYDIPYMSKIGEILWVLACVCECV